ncbi:hypothetical protein ACI78Q_11530 [Geodermatophilus sp. SYSU D00705]
MPSAAATRAGRPRRLKSHPARTAGADVNSQWKIGMMPPNTVFDSAAA